MKIRMTTLGIVSFYSFYYEVSIYDVIRNTTADHQP